MNPKDVFPFLWRTDASRRDLAALQRLLADESVRLDAVKLPAKRPDARTAYSGGEAHRLLCDCAARWLESQGGALAPYNEPTYAGGRADLASDDLSIAVECGYTNPGKVLKMLRSGGRLLIVPHTEDAEPIGYLFSARDGKLAPDREAEEMARAAISARAVPYVRPRT